MILKRYKVIDVNGNLRSIKRPPEMMQFYVDIGLAMEELPEPGLSFYKGSRDFFRKGNPIMFEPFKWDKRGIVEAYAPLFIAYRRVCISEVFR